MILDTNILIRLITKDNPELANKSLKLLEDAVNIYLPEAVLAEIIHVLEKPYKIQKDEIVHSLRPIFATKKIFIPPEAKTGFTIYESHPLSFVDCLVIAHALIKRQKPLSLDQDLLKIYQKLAKN